MKGIIWRIIPILLILLMFSHVIYYLSSNAGEIIEDGKIYSTRLQINVLKKTIKSYVKEYKNPTEIKSKLEDLMNKNKGISVDNWGNTFIVKRISYKKWLIISKGPDKRLGTSDDIKSIFDI